MTTANNNILAAPGRKIVLGVVLAGLAAIFLYSFVFRLKNPSLTVVAEKPAATPGAMGQGMNPEAMTQMMELMQRIKDNPDDPAVQVAAAEQFMMMGAWDRAKGFLDKILTVDPNNRDALNHLGVVLYNLDKPEEARGAFEKAMALDPDDFRSRFNLGLLYKHALNQPDKAAEFFRAVIASDKTDEKTRTTARTELGEPGK